MSLAEWYLAATALGTGVAIGAYWLAATAFGVVPLPAMGQRALELHIVAEFVTAGALLAAGLARLMTEAAWIDELNGVGLGLLVYAMIGSAPFYPRRALITVMFTAGSFTAVSALVVLLAT